MRAIVAASAFLVLFATTMLVGGHAAIGSLLGSVFSTPDEKSMGDIVLAMPDGKFCRHMSFDNATAEMVETTVAACPDDIAKGRGRKPRGFAWSEE